MTSPPASSLRSLLVVEKMRYLEGTQTDGGTAQGFRDHIRGCVDDDPLKYTKLAMDAVMEASTKAWQTQPRQVGPDLFSIGGLVIPEILTRPAKGSIDDPEDEERYEKVNHKFATVSDLYDDATITLRVGARTSARGERKMDAADEARRRARNNMSAFLKDLADKE